MSVTDDWNATRLVLEDHQHAGNQIGGACACGYRGDRRSNYLDHLADVLLGCQEE